MLNEGNLPEKLIVLFSPNAVLKKVQQVLDYLKSHALATPTEIARGTGVSHSSVKSYLAAMLACGMVEQERHGNSRLFYLKEMN